MADAAVAAARRGAQVWFVTIEPSKPFKSAGGRESMVELLTPHGSLVHLVSEKAGFEFEFGSGDYRASRYLLLVKNGVPAGTPIVVSDDMAVWRAAAAVADVYPMIGVLHGDQDYYADTAARFEHQLSAAVCVSDRVRARLLKRSPGFQLSRIFVIPCGVVLPPVSVRDQHEGMTRLAFIGRLSDYEKRAYDLVTICAELHRRGCRFTLDIVGSSAASGDEYRKKFAAVGVAGFVRFHGWQPAAAVYDLLAGTDIVMLTSNSEGMPLVMMEALGAGCGFVGTRVSGIEDYEHNALAADCLGVYPVGETDAAVDAIMKLAGVPVSQRAASARQLAEQEFTMDVCLDRYAAAIRLAPAAGISPLPVSMSATATLSSFARALLRYIKVSLKGK